MGTARSSFSKGVLHSVCVHAVLTRNCWSVCRSVCLSVVHRLPPCILPLRLSFGERIHSWLMPGLARYPPFGSGHGCSPVAAIELVLACGSIVHDTNGCLGLPPPILHLNPILTTIFPSCLLECSQPGAKSQRVGPAGFRPDGW